MELEVVVLVVVEEVWLGVWPKAGPDREAEDLQVLQQLQWVGLVERQLEWEDSAQLRYT